MLRETFNAVCSSIVTTVAVVNRSLTVIDKTVQVAEVNIDCVLEEEMLMNQIKMKEIKVKYKDLLSD